MNELPAQQGGVSTSTVVLQSADAAWDGLPPANDLLTDSAPAERVGECPEMEGFLRWLGEGSWRTDSGDAARKRANAQRRMGLVAGAVALITGSFCLGQRLPPETCRHGIERGRTAALRWVAPIRHNVADPASASQVPAPGPATEDPAARLGRLDARFCGGCGTRVWPLSENGERCPVCDGQWGRDCELVDQFAVVEQSSTGRHASR